MEVEFLEVTDSCVILGEKNLGITLSREYVFLKDHTLLVRLVGWLYWSLTPL